VEMTVNGGNVRVVSAPDIEVVTVLAETTVENRVLVITDLLQIFVMVLKIVLGERVIRTLDVEIAVVVTCEMDTVVINDGLQV